MVFVPLAPTAGVGTLRIVKESRIRLMNVAFGDAVGCLFNWGVGTAELLEAHQKSQEIDLGAGEATAT